jgi:hypothetical protein
VRTYQREDASEKREVSNVLSSSRPVADRAANLTKDFPVDVVEELDDTLLVQAFNEYEEKVVTPSMNMSGLFEGATVKNVTINVNFNK